MEVEAEGITIMATSRKGPPIAPPKGKGGFPTAISRNAGTGQFTTVRNAPYSPKSSIIETVPPHKSDIELYPQGSFATSAVVQKVGASFDTQEEAVKAAKILAQGATGLRSHDDAMAERYLKDPTLAVETLDAILEDGDQGELLVTLRQMALAKGIGAIAEETDLNRSQLYRTLSEHGNPSLNNLIVILKAMGLRLSIQPIAQG